MRSSAGSNIQVGDFVQWSPGGVDQFKPTRQVTKVDAQAGYAFVQGSNTGLPINELTVVTGIDQYDDIREEEHRRGKVRSGNGADAERGVTLDDFWAYMVEHKYIFAPTGDLWPGSSTNARIPPIQVGVDDDGDPVMISAAAWLDRNKPVEQVTWAPGEPAIITGRLISHGGWIPRSKHTVFNLYRPPLIEPGNAAEADRWIDHVEKVYPDHAAHIIKWCAHRVQQPHVKINHALVFGGAQGIGKDTLLEPVKRAVGPWNFTEVSPQQMLGRFNGFVKSIVLRVNEARDLGEVNRYSFYDHMKAYLASPPDVLRVDEKNRHEYPVFNCCGVILTSNHKADGIYLPADDRRHYVAWSDLTKNSFVDDYWTGLWHWFDHGGDRAVAAYLAELDISEFDPKAPPAKTEAFWDIVHANSAPEEGELADALEAIGFPYAVTLEKIIDYAPGDLGDWLRDRRNARAIPHRLESCGYVVVRNSGSKDGRWKVYGRHQTIYGKAELPLRERLAAAARLAQGGRS